MTSEAPATLTTHQAGIIARKQLEAIVASRAWEDDAFRRQLESNPAAAIASLGIEIPADFRIEIVEEAENTFDLSLAEPPAKPAEVLTEDETRSFLESLQDPTKANQTLERYFNLYR